MKSESVGVLATDRFATSQTARKPPLQCLQGGSEILREMLRTALALIIRSHVQCRHYASVLAFTATIIPVEIRTTPNRPTLRAASKIGVLQIHITATPEHPLGPVRTAFSHTSR